MPPFPSEEFLLWREVSGSGQWRKLMQKRLTRTRWTVILMLQELRDEGRSGEVSEPDPLEKLERALAAGWGA